RFNIRYLAAQYSTHGMKLRPHAKTHKSAHIAREQIEAGAVGVCCATPHEVMALGKGGVPQIHLTTPVGQSRHFSELAALHANGLDLMVVVDHIDQLPQWKTALGAVSRPLPVLVDIDIGMGRTGVTSSQAAIDLARQLKAYACFKYAGVQ